MKINCLTRINNNKALNFKAKPMPRSNAGAIDDKLKSSKHVDIICHETSDRDSVNCALVMSEYLRKYHVDTRIIIDQNLALLKLRYNDENVVQASDLDDDTAFETALCVDFNSKERANPRVLRFIEDAENVVCIDHHVQAKSVMNPNDSCCYIDDSAVSASSVLYRYFEALNKTDEIDKDMAFDLLYGFCDDAQKRGLIKCNGEDGTIYSSKDFMKNKESYDIFLKLARMVGQNGIAKITKNIDIISSLSLEEQEFRKSLKDSLRFSENGRIAYVAIPPNDEMWKKLGEDNSRTSAILNRFRQDTLNKYPRVRLALAFYSAGDRYRISAHCSDRSLLKFYKYVEDTKIPDFTKNAGGHSSRGGGKIFTVDPAVCDKWVKDIVSCESFYNK